MNSSKHNQLIVCHLSTFLSFFYLIAADTFAVLKNGVYLQHFKN